MKHKPINYAQLARECAALLETNTGVMAIMVVLVLVKIQPWFGPIDPRKLDAQHFLTILCLGADILESERR